MHKDFSMKARAVGMCLLIALALLIGVSGFSEEIPSVLITQPVDETNLVTLRGNVHPLASSLYDLGEAPPDLPMLRMLMVLKRSAEQEHSLRTLLDNQQDRHSSSYHRWLKPEDFGKQFGPADADMATVTAWLSSHGFEISRVAKGRNIIEFSGTAAQVKEAFHTSIHKYEVNGKEHWANANDPQIPAALAPAVAGVHTLHNFLKKPMLRMNGQKVQAKVVTGKDGKPEVTFNGPPIHGLGPADFATIYNLLPLYPTSSYNQIGIIAAVGRSNINPADVGQFQSYLPVYPNFDNQFSLNPIINGPDPGDLGGGEEAEAVLDLTWSQFTRYSSFLVVSATTNTTDGIDLSESYIIDNDLSDIITESFGTCEAALTATEVLGYETMAEQAAAQGMTYFVSSGDSGAEGCDSPDDETVATGPLSVNALAATPYTLAVGGTMFNEDGDDAKYWSSTNTPGTLESALSYVPEDVWNESCEDGDCPIGYSPNIAAGSGGVSQYFAKPSWQSGVGVPNDGQRDVPDVALNAAAGHDPYLICLDGSCTVNQQGQIYLYAIGGTSASAPSFAAIMSLVDLANGGRQGHAAYIFYRLAAGENLADCNASNTSTLPGSACIFNDVTSGNNAVPGETGYGTPTAPYQSGVGYDLATGLGSVNVANLVDKWNSVTFNATTTTLNLSPTSNIVHGQPVNVNVSVSGNSGTPTGDVVLYPTIVGLGQPVPLFALSDGAVASSTGELPGGSYSVYAHYAGDDTFATSDSSWVPVTVTPENSTTSLSLFTVNPAGIAIPFSGGVYGTFVYPRADIAGLSGQGIPTGTVNFLDGTTHVSGDPYPLNSEGNSAPPLGIFNFPAGSHSLTAAYGGDQSFNASTSSPVGFSITPATSSLTLTASPGSPGAILTASVNTNSGGNPPTGTVTFYINGAQVGSPVAVVGNAAVINASSDLVMKGAFATATYTDSGLNAGSYSAKAVYSGDANYTGSSGTATVMVQPDFSLTEASNLVNISAPGASGTLILTVASLDGFNGSVGFSQAACQGLPAGASCSFSPATIDGSGSTTLTITTTAATAAQARPSDSLPLFTSLGGWMAGCVLLGFGRKPKVARVVVMATLLAVSAITGCGGGSSTGSTSTPPPPTPTGSFPVGIVATSVSTGQTLVHNVVFTLNVQ